MMAAAGIKARFIEPMLLQRTEKLPAGRAIAFELKFDGFRAEQSRTATESTCVRNDKDFNARYPAIV